MGGAGKSGLSLAAAPPRGPARHTVIGVVPNEAEARGCATSGLADQVVVADARDPVALRDAVAAAGGPADVTVVCVDVPGCEGGAILATAPGRTVIFFSMATSFTAAALGAEGARRRRDHAGRQRLRAGHAAFALELMRANPASAGSSRPAAVNGGDRCRCDPGGSTSTRRPSAGQGPGPQGRASRSSSSPRRTRTVSVERAMLRLAGLEGADDEGTPWVNRLVDACGPTSGWSTASRSRSGTPYAAVATPTWARWPRTRPPGR